jgi:hypothetical protein
MLRAALVILVAAVVWLVATARADASRYVRFGVQDDAWLLGGPGTFEERLATVEELGADVVRVNLRWNEIAKRRPKQSASDVDPAYRWNAADVLLDGLRAHGITPVVTLVGTPRWANRGRGPSWAPTSTTSFSNFAYAAAQRYPFVRHWVIWNEPNKGWSLRPTRPSTYVRVLLNPAYDALKRANRANLVAGGVTAPRGGAGSVSPVAWLRGMRAARARLDAYAHHPYPVTRTETPFTGGCRSCSTLTMASLDRLLSAVRRAFGRKRIWLTEYGYQTSPADPVLGVSQARQARYHAEASYRAWLAPRVDMLIHFLVRDEERTGRWQSGLYTFHDAPKLSASAFRLPLAQAARSGATVTLWGQVRPGRGAQPFRLRARVRGASRWLGPTRWTDSRGIVRVRVTLPRGTSVQLWSRGAAGVPLSVR